jgi:hypothetical protein
VRLGSEQRTVHVIDSSSSARLRASGCYAWLGKGYYHRARRAVKANIVAVLTTVVGVGRVRVGLVRRTRFGRRCEVVDRQVRVRRWCPLHVTRASPRMSDGVRADDSASKRPLLIGTPARELTICRVRAA